MNESSFCNDTISLLKRPSFKGLLSLELSIGLFGILTNILLLISLSRTRIFHNNLRVLLLHMCLTSLCYCLAMSGKITYIFIQSVLDPCVLVLSLFDCKLSELFVIMPFLGMTYSLVPVGLERAYATFMYHTYEKSKSIWLSSGLIAVLWISAWYIQLSALASVSKSMFTPFCVNVMVMTRTSAVTMLIIGLIQEVVALTLYMATYFINGKLYANLLVDRSLSDQTLSGRFQIAQNIQVTELMLPTAAIHATFLLPTNALAVLVISEGIDISFNLRVELVHACYLSALIYAASNPIICFIRNLTLRKALLSIMRNHQGNQYFQAAVDENMQKYLEGSGRCSISGVARDPNVRSDQHFDILNRYWNKS